MQTLAVSTWHEAPHLLLEQVNNYNAAFEGKVIHLININRDYQKNFWADAERKNINFDKVENVFFIEPPAKTFYCGVAHAYLIMVQYAMKMNFKFDYIYFHTSSDLLVKRGIDTHIRNHDIGFGKAGYFEIKYRTDHRGHVLLDFGQENLDPQLSSISLDPAFARVTQATGMEKLYKSRSEGCFFSRETFFEVMFPLTSNMSAWEMQSIPKPYPIEEYLFAQCVEFFCDRHNVRRTAHVIETSRSEKFMASISEIDDVISRPDKFGIKRFDMNLDSEPRQHIRRSLNIT